MWSLEQERAKFAYNAISDVKEENSEIQKKYSSYVKSAPVMTLTNGLAATLTFYLSKMKMESDTEYPEVWKEIRRHRAREESRLEGKPERVAYAYLFCQTSTWLAEKSNLGRGMTGGKDPLKFMLEDADVLKTLRMTQETLHLLNWMKRFADAMLEKEEG